MKKVLVSALAALAMVVGGVAPAAHASASSVTLSRYTADGDVSLSGGQATVVLDSPATYLNIYINYAPDSNTYAALAGTSGANATLELTGTLTHNGSAVSGVNLMANDATKPNGNWLSGTSVTGNVTSFALPGTSTAEGTGNQARFGTYMYLGSSVRPSGLAAGTYVFTPQLKINGANATGTFTTTVNFSATFETVVPTSANADYIYKEVLTCVDTTGFTAGDVLEVTGYNNGAAGSVSGYTDLNASVTAASSGQNMPTALAGTNGSTGVKNFTLGANDVGKLVAVTMITSNAPIQGTESYDMVVKKNGTGSDISVNCGMSNPTGTIDNSGVRVVVTLASFGVAGYSGNYMAMCRATRVDNGMMASSTVAINGVCNLNNLSASVNYNILVNVSLNAMSVTYFKWVNLGQSLGAQGSGSPQVVVVTPVAPVVPVFKQPKFAMPSKIDVDTTGKVSLSGKDMGVSTVLIGGKEQKIDTNSDEKLVFDTTGLAKGVHDLVMKGAFGTYTIQKAIQVGEAVVTKVAAVSARQVGMAGGELSISGQGLEGTTQITMNGQVLEIVSKTDSKVTFKVPASTVASVNSIMIEGSFVPVIFKNAFSYTK